MKKLIPLLFLLPFLSACERIDFNEAESLEKQDMSIKAANLYEAFALKKPEDLKAPDALFKAAQIYSLKYHLCKKSKPLYEKLVREYKDYSFLSEARRGIFMCPDYFPMRKSSKWVYGDSETGGKNMKQYVKAISFNSSFVAVETKFYAGKEFVRKLIKKYYFSDYAVRAKEKAFDTIILKYPIMKNKKWKKGGVFYKVAAMGLKVRVRGGLFSDCVKIKEYKANSPSWMYVYYAPWVGKVLTTVAGTGFENRVEELISYEK